MPMLRTGLLLFALVLTVVAWGGPAAADEPTPAPKPSLTDPGAFERAYGASFYGFDACGDALTGKEFRSVLVDKFAHCPFSSEARKQFSEWTKGQRLKSSKAIEAMIIAHGGLPVQLEGMSTTCHDRFSNPDYQRLRADLDRYQQGRVKASDVLHEECGAANITP